MFIRHYFIHIVESAFENHSKISIAQKAAWFVAVYSKKLSELAIYPMDSGLTHLRLIQSL